MSTTKIIIVVATWVHTVLLLASIINMRTDTYLVCIRYAWYVLASTSSMGLPCKKLKSGAVEPL